MSTAFKLGGRLELLKPGLSLDSPEALSAKLVTAVHDVISDKEIVIDNPTKGATLVPLHTGDRFSCFAFLGGKIYKGELSTISSVKDGNVRVCHMKVTTALDKYERRQFFRLDTTMNIRYLLITAENSQAFKVAVASNSLLTMQGFKNGTTMDISGGGVRFSSSEQLPIGGLVITHLTSHRESGNKEHVFLGKVIFSEQRERVRGVFEHRMQFVDLNQSGREEFVQFIFETERNQLAMRAQK